MQAEDWFICKETQGVNHKGRLSDPICHTPIRLQRKWNTFKSQLFSDKYVLELETQTNIFLERGVILF